MELFTISDAAKMLGVDHSTLARQAKKGVLKTVLQKPFYLMSQEQINDYRDKHLGKRGYASPLHKGKHGRTRKPKGGDA